jgi:hypothetical protein
VSAPVDVNHRTDHQGSRGIRRRTVIAASAAVILTAATAAVAGGVLLLLRGPGVPAGSPTSPVALPDTVTGLRPLPADQDPTANPNWQDSAAKASGGVTLEAHTYGKGEDGRTVRVVAARTDLTQKLELAWAADQGQETGIARCTNNLVVAPRTPPRVRPTVMLCWRTGPTFSAYTLVIAPRATKQVSAQEGADALETVWKTAVAGR